MKPANPFSHFSAPVAAMIVLLSSLAQGFETPITALEHLDDHNLILYINDQELDHTAAWTPADSPPPMSMRDAIAATKTWAEQRYPGFDGFELHEIAIKHIASREHHKRWFYLVYLDALRAGKVVRKRQVFAAVLFDGKVIPATEKPNL